MELDALDAAIVRVLLQEARLSLRAVAREVGSTPTTVGERLRRLEAAGLVVGASLRLDPALVPAQARLVRGHVPQPARDGILRAARSIVGLADANLARDGRFHAVIRVRDLADEERVLAALAAAGAEDLGADSVERIEGPPAVHLFERAVSVAEPCAQCARETIAPIVERVDGRRVPFCCTSCQTLYGERYVDVARRAAKGAPAAKRTARAGATR